MLRSFTGLSAILIAGLTAGTAQATSVSLAFDSLPSAQGWTYLAQGDGGGLAESDVFQATGTSLIQNTIGVGMTTAGGNLHQIGVAIGATENFTLTVRAAIRQGEGVPFNGSTAYPFGLSIGVATQGAYNLVGVSGSRFGYTVGGVSYGDFMPGFDPAAMNTYELIGVGGRTSFRINGVTLLSNVQFDTLGGPSSLIYGDGTGFGNASVVTSLLQFNAGVPEPASWAMMLPGFGALGVAVRRREGTVVVSV